MNDPHDERTARGAARDANEVRKDPSHLCGQLAGRHEHEGRNRAPSVRAGRCEALEYGQGEGEGLARARLGAGAEIAPGEYAGYRLGLYGKGLGIAEFPYGSKQLGR